MSTQPRNLALPRIAAYFIDWSILAAYGGTLFGVMFAIHGAEGLSDLGETMDPFVGQLVGLVSMTLPFALYFAVLESRQRAATIGKRVLKLHVQDNDGARLTFGRALLRAGLKFTPWELAHVFVHHMADHHRRTPEEPEPLWLWIVLGVSGVGAAFYFFSLFSRNGLTPYDRLAGTRVVAG